MVTSFEKSKMQETFKSSQAKLAFAALLCCALVALSDGGQGIHEGEVKLHQERELIGVDEDEDSSFFLKDVDVKTYIPPLDVETGEGAEGNVSWKEKR